MTKLIFRAVSLLAGMVGGLLAGAIFKKAWQLAAREDEAPKATDAARGWHEILIAAVLSGAGVQRLLRRPRRPSGLEDGPHVRGARPANGPDNRSARRHPYRPVPGVQSAASQRSMTLSRSSVSTGLVT